MTFRRAARKDDNHNDIQRLFEQAGFSVKDTSQLKGFVDLVAARNGETVLIEIKDGSKKPSERKLSKAEIKFHAGWKGKIFIVECADDAQRVIIDAGGQG